MSYKDLPVELSYDIIGRIIAEYIDTAISSPPKPSYLLPHSDEVVSKVQALLTAERKKDGTFIPVTIGSDRTEWTDITPEEFNSALEKLDTLGEGAAPDDTFVSDEEITWNSENSTDSDSDEEEEEEEEEEEVEVMEEVEVEEEEEEEELDRDRVTRLFKEWERDESLEKLPKSAIQPLLGVNRSTRAVTLKVVYDALGLDPAQSNESINLLINRLLHDVRKRLRLVCTEPFCLWDDLVPEYHTKPGAEALLISMYLRVSRCTMGKVSDVGTLNQMRLPSPVLLPYVHQRLGIASTRFKIAMKCLQLFCDPHLVISDDMFAKAVPFIDANLDTPTISSSIDFERERRLLKGAVDRLYKFDDENMDRHWYAELPGTIIKSLPIFSSKGLHTILMANQMRVLEDMEDIKYCGKKVEELFRRWVHRYNNCKTDYVVLTLPS